MHIVSLMENTTKRKDLTAEHGLSLYIEAMGHRILFDTGPDGAFADNAKVLGIDLSGVDLAVLSHGHYDHGGGLVRFFEENDHAPVFVQKSAFAPHFNRKGKYIGLDPALSGNPCFRVLEGDAQLFPGIDLCTLKERDCITPVDTDGMTTIMDGDRVADTFNHEQYLLLTKNGKRVLISGCSHRGIRNIAAKFRPDILIGGFHFMHVEDDGVLVRAAKDLLSYPTTYLTCHCTGERAYGVMRGVMGDRLSYLSCGSETTV